MGVKTRVSEDHCVLIGARDLDLLEREALKKSKVTVFTMRDIDEHGMYRIMQKALKIACEGVDALHVSFDLDSMDPVEAPGVGTPVQGGITYREAHLAMELISECDKLRSLEDRRAEPYPGPAQRDGQARHRAHHVGAGKKDTITSVLTLASHVKRDCLFLF